MSTKITGQSPDVPLTPTLKVELLKQDFDAARKLYPGTKRGCDTEFDNFVKKHKDWKQVIPLLHDAIEDQKRNRMIKQHLRRWTPEWKNFCTWINQRCWEESVEFDRNYKHNI